MLLGLILIVVLVAITGFFVASEFALVSVRKTRIEQLASEGSKTAVQVKHALENLQTYIAATQAGITLATLGLGALGEPVLTDNFVPLLELILPRQLVETFVSFHGLAFGLSFLLITIVEIILGEIVPKIVARQKAEATVLLVIRPLTLFLLVFRPLIWVINSLGNVVLRLIRLRPDMAHSNVHSVEELEMLVTSSRKAGVLEEEEEAILRRVFDLSDITARQVMVPRTEMSAIPATATFAEVMDVVEREKHSRFPIYEGDLDNIIGVLYVKDMFLALAHQVESHPDSPFTKLSEGFNVRALRREILNVPETVDVNDLLARMRHSRIHIAVVIDEYGGTAGIVTLEDVVEEIVGEVRDEFEGGEDHPAIVVTPEGALVDGMTPIDDVNEQLGLSIQSEADTLGGYVFEVLGRKPELGDEVHVNGQVLRVDKLDGLRIAQVRIMPAQEVTANLASEE